MGKKSLLKGAAVMAAAGIIVKLLGAVFRIPLANMIGSIGMANYSPAYSLYSFLLVFATAGLPVAISKMVSERYAVGQFREAERVFRLSRTLMMIIGIIGFIVLFFCNELIAELIKFVRRLFHRIAQLFVFLIFHALSFLLPSASFSSTSISCAQISANSGSQKFRSYALNTISGFRSASKI